MCVGVGGWVGVGVCVCVGTDKRGARQASKEAIARAEKHAREMSQLRSAHAHEVPILHELLRLY